MECETTYGTSPEVIVINISSFNYSFLKLKTAYIANSFKGSITDIEETKCILMFIGNLMNILLYYVVINDVKILIDDGKSVLIDVFDYLSEIGTKVEDKLKLS